MLKIVIPGFANSAWLRGRRPLLADAPVHDNQFSDQLPRTLARAIFRGWQSHTLTRCASIANLLARLRFRVRPVPSSDARLGAP